MEECQTKRKQHVKCHHGRFHQTVTLERSTSMTLALIHTTGVARTAPLALAARKETMSVLWQKCKPKLVSGVFLGLNTTSRLKSVPSATTASALAVAVVAATAGRAFCIICYVYFCCVCLFFFWMYTDYYNPLNLFFFFFSAYIS